LATFRVNQVSLEYEWWGPNSGATPMLLLHEAMGSVRSWAGFGERLARSADRRVYAYSRQGHGGSAPLRHGLPDDYVEREGLEVLPALREMLRLEDVILVGLNEGASMALVHAGGSSLTTSGVVAVGPLVASDRALVEAVRTLQRGFETSALKEHLASTTGDAEATFRQWARLWTGKKHEKWKLDDFLKGITCPVLAVRGELDPFCSPGQLERLAAHVHQVDVVHLKGCSNMPQREKPGALIAELNLYLQRLTAAA